MKFIIYNKLGRILRVVDCPKKLGPLQVKKGELIMKGQADDLKQKIVDGKVVDKTAEEVETDNPTVPRVSSEKYPAKITREQWENVLDRLEKLETR